MREKTVVKGLVLRSTDTREADQMLTVLTGPLGKVSVVAKGARSRRSRISAAAQLLCYSEMVLTESHGWQILSEASTLELFDPLRRDVVLLSLGSYFAELTDAVTPAGLEAGETLSLLLNALYALGHLQKDPALVKAAFECRLMALSGFEPLMAAYALPKDDPTRPETLEAATVSAAMAPLGMVGECCRAVVLLEEMGEKCSRMLVSDVACGALLVRAAIEAASVNVYVNTASLSDRAQAERIDSTCEELVEEYVARAERLARNIVSGIRGGGA